MGDQQAENKGLIYLVVSVNRYNREGQLKRPQAVRGGGHGPPQGFKPPSDLKQVSHRVSNTVRQIRGTCYDLHSCFTRGQIGFKKGYNLRSVPENSSQQTLVKHWLKQSLIAWRNNLQTKTQFLMFSVEFFSSLL